MTPMERVEALEKVLKQPGGAVQMNKKEAAWYLRVARAAVEWRESMGGMVAYGNMAAPTSALIAAVEDKP